MKVIPIVEVVARPFGSIQWICPSCGEIHGASPLPWRRAQIQCTHCRRKFRIGLAFGSSAVLLPPFNALFVGAWNGYTANRLGEPKSLLPAYGRIRGRIDFTCPACSATQAANLGTELSDLKCLVCDKVFYIRLLFYSPLPGAFIKCPIDWSPDFEVKESILNPAPLAEDPESPGTAG